jgi:hypothetical protein
MDNIEPKIEPFFRARICGINVVVKSPLPVLALFILAVVTFFVVRHVL